VKAVVAAVVPEAGENVPQVPAPVKVTLSDAGPVRVPVTVAVRVSVLVPLPTIGVVPVTTTVSTAPVWVIVVEALLPPLASLAVITQVPVVAPAV
jgi:hypothetical protein